MAPPNFAQCQSGPSLLGTWRLVSYEARDSEGRVQYPLGENVSGLLVYDGGGNMSAHVMEGNFVSTFLGDGMGNFALKQTINLGEGNLKGEIALGDFDEDGILDVAYPVTGDISGTHSTTVLIFFGDGAGNLVTGPSVTVGQEPHTVITADFNNNGHLDLAVTNRTDGTISILLGNGRGNFTLATTLSVISPELNP